MKLLKSSAWKRKGTHTANGKPVTERTKKNQKKSQPENVSMGANCQKGVSKIWKSLSLFPSTELARCARSGFDSVLRWCCG